MQFPASRREYLFGGFSAEDLVGSDRIVMVEVPSGGGTPPLVRPRAHSKSWVKVPTGGEADPFVAESNCVAERRGGEQLEANNQPVNTTMLNSIRFQSTASPLAKGEAREPDAHRQRGQLQAVRRTSSQRAAGEL